MHRGPESRAPFSCAELSLKHSASKTATTVSALCSPIVDGVRALVAYSIWYLGGK